MNKLWQEGVASPCVKVCELDENNLCLGCYRSRGEITCWSTASDTEKKRILELVFKRKSGIAD